MPVGDKVGLPLRPFLGLALAVDLVAARGLNHARQAGLHVGKALLDVLEIQLLRAEPEHVALPGDGGEVARHEVGEAAARCRSSNVPAARSCRAQGVKRQHVGRRRAGDGQALLVQRGGKIGAGHGRS